MEGGIKMSRKRYQQWFRILSAVIIGILVLALVVTAIMPY